MTLYPSQKVTPPHLPHLSSCLTYAKRVSWTDPADGRQHTVRVGFQLRIRPGVYTVGPSTTGLRHYDATDRRGTGERCISGIFAGVTSSQFRLSTTFFAAISLLTPNRASKGSKAQRAAKSERS